MFSRKARRPDPVPSFTSPDLTRAWASLESGDVAGAMRALRGCAETVPLRELGVVVQRAAAAAGFDDLREAAAKIAATPDGARGLYDFGYACIERGADYLAVPALREVVRLHPDAAGPRRELVSAYEGEDRHGEAVELLLGHEDALDDWPDRYLLVFDAVTAGRLHLAQEQFARLSAPTDEMWGPAHARLGRVLSRAAAVQASGASALDRTDLRGWQFVLRGSVLGTLSPFGFTAGMTGRYAFLQDSWDACRTGLDRLRRALAAAELAPSTVSLLPDRGSQILGLAAAELFGLPAVPFDASREATIVVAYDLKELLELDGDAGVEALRALVDRTPGQILHEHASCWTDTPPVTADSVGLLAQTVVPPWGERLQASASGTGAERLPADDRPAAELATEIVRAKPTLDAGDGETPADPDASFSAFVSAIAPSWLQGPRDRVRAMGPVPSSRFR